MDNNIFILNEKRSVANHFLAELRDKTHQKDRMRFRKNLERLGEIMAYEISQKLPFEHREIHTPLGKLTTELLQRHPLLVTILRAGIPFHQGFLNFFEHSDSGFIGAWRNEDLKNLKANIDYIALPHVDGKPVVLIDPMLATGQSVLNTLKQLLLKGTPSHLFIVSVVAAPEGIRLLKENITLPFSLWTCALDEKLNSAFYIIPGLGDAGDLCYGVKE